MNTFMNQLESATNFKTTENGAVAHKSTRSAVYDMFALGGAYRSRSIEDCILLFKNAIEENEKLALKCLFYLRDCRGGQGERRFFRVCYQWLIQTYPEIAKRNLVNISEFGRWDDLIYIGMDSKLKNETVKIVKNQLALDLECKTPSLLAKWMPSENASALETKRMAKELRKAIGVNSKEYRVILSTLRRRINVLERLMSAGEWDKIEFDKIPSKAGLKYKNAFARRDIIAKKYEAFAKDENTKVNASVLNPVDVIGKVTSHYNWWGNLETNFTSIDRAIIEKYWNNLPDYLNGADCSMMCVVDTSGSMIGKPMDAAIGLGMYCAERLSGPFKDNYISFSSKPQLIKIKGIDFVDKVNRIYSTNLCENTNLSAVFDLLLSIAKHPDTKVEDIPKTIVVISDMEIDSGTSTWRGGYQWTISTAETEMEKIRKRWTREGFELPKLVYWNVNARHDTILDAGPSVSFVSGYSPVIFEQILTGKTGYDLMLDKLMSKRYEVIK